MQQPPIQDNNPYLIQPPIDAKYSDGSWLPDDPQGITQYQLETKELLEDLFNLIENKTLMDKKGNFYRAPTDKPLLNKTCIILLKISLRACSDKVIALSLTKNETSEAVAKGLTDRVLVMINEAETNQEILKINQSQKNLLLYMLNYIFLALLNKAIEWKTLEESNKIRRVNENVGQPVQQGFSLPFTKGGGVTQ